MSLFMIAIIASGVLLLIILLAIFYRFWLKPLSEQSDILTTQLAVNELVIKEMQQMLDDQHTNIDKFTEQQEKKNSHFIEVVSDLDNKRKLLQQDIIGVKEQLQQYQEQQPEDKLYSRAFKLAALGADIEEIMTECELPHAEAEMLLSLYQQKIRQS